MTLKGKKNHYNVKLLMGIVVPSSVLEQLGSILRSKCRGLRFELCLCCFIKHRWRRCASCDRYTNLHEEILLTGR